MNKIERRLQELRHEATILAGAPEDICQRAMLLHQIYIDSGGNHSFPEIAAHGALWALGFFEATGSLGKIISYRYVLNREEMSLRHGMLQTFSDGFKSANRSVFIDTYSNFYFTRELDEPSSADELIEPELVNALFEIHSANRRGRKLDAGHRRDLFERVLDWEQRTTVAPKVDEEVQKFDCPILRALVLKPAVRFSYFPRWKYLYFRNFNNTEERIRKAHISFDLAERCGWPGVFSALETYKALPAGFFRDPAGYTREMKRRLLGGGTGTREE
jgi:hypothetical protein